MAPWNRQHQAQAQSCDVAGSSSLYQPLGITVLVSVAISAISMGALIMLLVYLRKLMQRLSSLTAKMEAQHLVTLDELRRLRAEVTFDDSASQTNNGSGNGLSSLDFGCNGLTAGALPRATSGERTSAGSQGRPPAPPNPSSDLSTALQLPYGNQPTQPRGSGSGGNINASGSGGGGGGGGGGQNGSERRGGPNGGQGPGSTTPTRWSSGNNGGGKANGGVLPRVPSIGAQSSGGGSWLDGYSSGEDLTSEEHLDLTRRTIKRTLSNSSIASVHLALTSPGLRESVSKSDLETLNYMFGDESEGVGC